MFPVSWPPGMGQPGVQPGKHERDVAVGQPAHHVGGRSVAMVQADDHAGTLAVNALRDKVITHTGLHGAPFCRARPRGAGPPSVLLTHSRGWAAASHWADVLQ